jgi:hypothetical protein
VLDFINIINFALYNNLATFAASNSFVILVMEGRGFYGSFMGVRVLELEYKRHLGSISLSFSNAKPHICFDTYVFVNLVHFIYDL